MGRSLPLLPPPLRSRSLLLLRGSTPSGSEAPSLLPSPPSSRCGSPSRSTTSAAPPSSTGSASKHIMGNLYLFDISDCLFRVVDLKIILLCLSRHSKTAATFCVLTRLIKRIESRESGNTGAHDITRTDRSDQTTLRG